MLPVRVVGFVGLVVGAMLVLCGCVSVPPSRPSSELPGRPQNFPVHASTGRLIDQEITRRLALADEAETRAAAALRLIRKGDQAGGVAGLERAVGIFPESPALRVRRGRLVTVWKQETCRYAESLAKSGRRDEAKRLLKQLLEKQ